MLIVMTNENGKIVGAGRDSATLTRSIQNLAKAQQGDARPLAKPLPAAFAEVEDAVARLRRLHGRR